MLKGQMLESQDKFFFFLPSFYSVNLDILSISVAELQVDWNLDLSGLPEARALPGELY